MMGAGAKTKAIYSSFRGKKLQITNPRSWGSEKSLGRVCHEPMVIGLGWPNSRGVGLKYVVHAPMFRMRMEA